MGEAVEYFKNMGYESVFLALALTNSADISIFSDRKTDKLRPISSSPLPIPLDDSFEMESMHDQSREPLRNSPTTSLDRSSDKPTSPPSNLSRTTRTDSTLSEPPPRRSSPREPTSERAT